MTDKTKKPKSYKLHPRTIEFMAGAYGLACWESSGRYNGSITVAKLAPGVVRRGRFREHKSGEIIDHITERITERPFNKAASGRLVAFIREHGFKGKGLRTYAQRVVRAMESGNGWVAFAAWAAVCILDEKSPEAAMLVLAIADRLQRKPPQKRATRDGILLMVEALTRFASKAKRAKPALVALLAKSLREGDSLLRRHTAAALEAIGKKR